jgi:hypothetical protein
MANLKLKTQFNDLVDASVVENQIEDLTSSLDDYALKQQQAWITPTLVSGWTNVSGIQVIQYMKDEFGFVHIRGTTNGASKTDTVPFQLPVGYRPPNQLHVPLINLGTPFNPAVAIIDASGFIVVASSVYNVVVFLASFKVN